VCVLVTGGAGFIGSHLADALLERSEEVWVTDDLSTGRASRLHEKVVLRRQNIVDVEELAAVVEDARPELICHLAAHIDVRTSVARPANDARANIIGTVNVLEAARKVGARVLFCSSGGALYGRDAPIPSTENVPPMPVSPYGVAKYCAERYVNLYNELHGTSHAVLRLANVYGPRQHPSGEAGVVPSFCSRALHGEQPTIYGDGKQTRDYVYISDVVEAFLAAADCGMPGTWNIGTGIEVSVLDLAKLVSEISGRPLEPAFAPFRLGELNRSAVSADLAGRDLGWRPATALIDGLRSVYRWIEAGADDRADRSAGETPGSVERVRKMADLSANEDHLALGRHVRDSLLSPQPVRPLNCLGYLMLRPQAITEEVYIFLLTGAFASGDGPRRVRSRRVNCRPARRLRRNVAGIANLTNLEGSDLPRYHVWYPYSRSVRWLEVTRPPSPEVISNTSVAHHRLVPASVRTRMDRKSNFPTF
jgi:UDP-glucose 4-epimerase